MTTSHCARVSLARSRPAAQGGRQQGAGARGAPRRRGRGGRALRPRRSLARPQANEVRNWEKHQHAACARRARLSGARGRRGRRGATPRGPRAARTGGWMQGRGRHQHARLPADLLLVQAGGTGAARAPRSARAPGLQEVPDHVHSQRVGEGDLGALCELAQPAAPRGRAVCALGQCARCGCQSPQGPRPQQGRGAAAPDSSTRSVAHPIANSCRAPSLSAEPSSACACWLVVGRPCSSSPPHLIAALRLPSDRRGRPHASNLGAWRESERGSSTGAVTCAGGPHAVCLAAGALLLFPALTPSRQRRARGAVTRGGRRAHRYPAAARRWGTLATCRLGLWLAAPAAGAMAAPSLLPGARRAWAQAALAAVLCAKSVAATFAFTASMIMARGPAPASVQARAWRVQRARPAAELQRRAQVNAAAPVVQMGSVNGAGQTLASLVRFLGPASGGAPARRPASLCARGPLPRARRSPGRSRAQARRGARRSAWAHRPASSCRSRRSPRRWWPRSCCTAVSTCPACDARGRRPVNARTFSDDCPCPQLA